MTEQHSANSSANGTPSSAPRKRSKVSRACDECRRKKIRCDASPDNGPEQCSSCRRVGEKCSFSRIPMKRGPSKGYIKELEDRLNSLEHSMSSSEPSGIAGAVSSIPPNNNSSGGHKASVSSSSSGHNHGPTSPGSQYGSGGLDPLMPLPRPRTDSTHSIHSPTILNPVPPGPRKRAFSSVAEYTHDLNRSLSTGRSHFPPDRLPSIDSLRAGNNENHILPSLIPQPPTVVVDEPAPPYLPPPNAPNHYWKPPYEKNLGGQNPLPQVYGYQRHSIGVCEPRESSSLSVSDNLFPFVWEEECIDLYYSLVHPVFPVLAHSKARLRSIFIAAPSAVRNTCLYSLYALVRSHPASPPSFHSRAHSDLSRAIQNFNDAHASPADLPLSSALLLVQAAILLALEADNHGPRALESGPLRSKSCRLGSAIGLAHSLRLHALPSSASTMRDNAAIDIDSEPNTGRRIVLVLACLDRWTAASLALPLQYPESSFRISSSDMQTLTSIPYHLLRFSMVLGHIFEACNFNEDSMTGARHIFMATLLRNELDRIRESIEQQSDHFAVLDLAYWHIKLALYRLLNVPNPQILLGPALRIVNHISRGNILSQSSPFAGPLGHHFLALTGATLVDLADVHETRDDALRAINTFLDALAYTPTTHPSAATRWDSRIHALLSNPVASNQRNLQNYNSLSHKQMDSSLERLAAIAVGEHADAVPSNRLAAETIKLRNVGYLGYLIVG
ncbi:hypothetical protein V1511DRAFT_456861 [Dipodascopsis uninucleata]